MQVPSSLQSALRAAALVSQMAVQAVLGAMLGGLLDGWWGTGPILVLVLGGLGFTSGLLVLWRAFLAAQTDDDTPPDDPGPR